MIPNSTAVVADDSSKRIASKIAAASGSGPVRYDPTGGFARQRLAQDRGNRIEMGLVIRSGCGGYDCSVKIGYDSVACMVLSKNVAQAFGVSAGSVPVAGSYVLVLLIGGSRKIGYVIGTIPLSWRVKSNGLDKLLMSASCPNEKFDAYNDVRKSYLPFQGGPKHSDQIFAGSNRPRDINPGESTEVNENRVGVTENMYSVELSGGASYVRVDRMDDEIRMRSTNFQKWTNQEFDWEFNDGGYVSAEGRNYSYQGELLGAEGLKGPGYKKSEDAKDKEPRPRTRWWKGFLGNLFSWFVVRARQTPESDDETLVSVHASQGGNIMVRSTGGISLERYPKIPVPKRLKQPWDPSADKEKDVTHEPFKPFEVDDPHSRGIVESSKVAWEQKTMYQRFDELKKDFEVRDEQDVQPPGDKDRDPKGSEEIKQAEMANRKAGVYVGEDGSVIIRDAWGSEIVMVGGNILLNTAGNIIHTANKDIVSIARQSVVIRGTEAAEMSSEEGDTRIHAKKLVNVCGGTDQSVGGVLIESLGTTVVDAGPKAGRSAILAGVVIKCEEGGVSLDGKNTYVTGLDNVFITGGPNGGTREGNIFIDGKNTIMTGADLVAGIVETSSFLSTKDVSLLVSPGTSFVWGGSAMIMNGDEVPILWDSAGSPPDLSDLKEAWTLLQDSEIIEPYDWDNIVANACFSFRTATQARTNIGIEPWQPNDSFTLYEPYWQVMHDVGDPLAVGSPYHPKAESVHGSKCWPCVGPIDGGVFVTYGYGNIEKGLSKKRDSLDPYVGLIRGSMGEFKT